MIRPLSITVVAALALLLGAPHAVAGRVGLAYTHYYGAIQQPVEQETDWPFPADHSLWVTNPTGCAWDVDDNWQDLAYGTLNAGATLSVEECMIASQDPFYRTVYGQPGWWSSAAGALGVLVTSSSPDLVVTSCYAPQSRCFTAARTVESGGYAYRLCTRSAYDPGDQAMSVIPGSQGGVGLIQTITVNVTNPTSRSIKNVGFDVEAVGVAQGGGAGCVPGAPYTQDYPFTWT